MWECNEPHRLREAILDVVADVPRPGCPGKFTAEQVAQIVALACESPKLSGRPINHWTLRELRDEAVKRKIVKAISVAHVGRILQQAALQPHRKKMWLNTTEKDAEKFQREVETVCKTYLEAPAKAAAKGTHTVSIDEATALQAIERNAPDKPVQVGSVTKQEFEYTRHGTTTLTAGLDVAPRKEFLSDISHRIRFVYLPKHSSWLNQIEIIFGIIHRKCLRGGNFTSVADLESHLREFMTNYNTTMAHPFAWTYTGKPMQKARRPKFIAPHRRVKLSKTVRLAERITSCNAI